MKIYGLLYSDYATPPDFGGMFYSSKDKALEAAQKQGYTIYLCDDTYRHEEHQFRRVYVEEFYLDAIELGDDDE